MRAPHARVLFVVFFALYTIALTYPGIQTVFFLPEPALRPYQIHEGILGLAVNAVVLVAVSPVTRPQAADHAAQLVRGERAVETRSAAVAQV